MLLVKTKLAPSSIHGLGIFAEEFIPKGTTVWAFQPGFDVEKTPEEVALLPPRALEWIQHYGYRDIQLHRWIICVDDARFVNHSEDPNMKPDYARDPYGMDVACRDIHPGEEITDDYRLIEDREPPAPALQDL
jgi:uncharacterized protein